MWSSDNGSSEDFRIFREIVFDEKSALPSRIFHAGREDDHKLLCGLNENLPITELSYGDKNIWSYVHCERCMFIRNQWIIDSGLKFKPYKETEYERRRRTQSKGKKSKSKRKLSESSEYSSTSVRTVRGGLPSLGKRK